MKKEQYVCSSVVKFGMWVCVGVCGSGGEVEAEGCSRSGWRKRAFAFWLCWVVVVVVWRVCVCVCVRGWVPKSVMPQKEEIDERI